MAGPYLCREPASATNPNARSLKNLKALTVTSGQSALRLVRQRAVVAGVGAKEKRIVGQQMATARHKPEGVLVEQFDELLRR